jgi:hypothetical protein
LARAIHLRLLHEILLKTQASMVYYLSRIRGITANRGESVRDWQQIGISWLFNKRVRLDVRTRLQEGRNL